MQPEHGDDEYATFQSERGEREIAMQLSDCDDHLLLHAVVISLGPLTLRTFRLDCNGLRRIHGAKRESGAVGRKRLMSSSLTLGLRCAQRL